MWWSKKIECPKSDTLESLRAVQLTYVSWYKRTGRYYSDTEKCIEAFPSEDDAKKFAESLRCAFKLIRHTSLTEVKVYK
jgi:hypothetical protein